MSQQQLQPGELQKIKQEDGTYNFRSMPGIEEEYKQYHDRGVSLDNIQKQDINQIDVNNDS